MRHSLLRHHVQRKYYLKGTCREKILSDVFKKLTKIISSDIEKKNA